MRRWISLILAMIASTMNYGQTTNDSLIDTINIGESHIICIDIPELPYQGTIDDFIVQKIEQGFSLFSKDGNTVSFYGKRYVIMQSFHFDDNGNITLAGIITLGGSRDLKNEIHDGVVAYLERNGYVPQKGKYDTEDYVNRDTNIRCTYFDQPKNACAIWAFIVNEE